MTKSKIIYACNKCGSQFPKWAGQCAECGGWNTLAEEALSSIPSSSRHSGYATEAAKITLLSEVQLQQQPRIATSLSELNRVLGGGIVVGSMILIGGDPGIGKSTILIQTLCHLSQTKKALYVTGEESLQQVKLRARRLNLPENDLLLLSETNVEQIIVAAKKHRPEIMVVDSIQTIFTNTLQSAPGAVSQLRESTARLVRFAKQSNTAIFLVGHVTKEGMLAGPRVLEHMVDTVLYFEGDRDSRFRIIRAVKNRFGAVNELGIFAMTDQGLKEISNPSAIF